MSEMEYFLHEGKMLINKYDQSGISNHSTIKGNARENEIKDFLKKMLPSYVDICTGQVYSDSLKSKQIDLILYDNTQTAGLPIDNSTKLIPVDSVLAIIEIKSKLSWKTLKEAVENIQSFKSLVKRNIKAELDGVGRNPFTIIFAYESDEKRNLESVSKQLNKMLGKMEIPKTIVNLVSVLKEGAIHFDWEFGKYEYNKVYNVKEYKAFYYKENTLYEFFEALRLNI